MNMYETEFDLNDDSFYILLFLVEERSNNYFEREFRYKLVSMTKSFHFIH